MIRSFTHDGFAVKVDASEEDLVWLEEMLGPPFSVSPAEAGPGDALVSFSGGRRPAVDARPARTRVAFALDSGPIRLPAWAQGDLWRLHDERGAVLFDVIRNGRETDIRYYGSRLEARVHLMRVVREYAHNQSLSTGAIVFHAAAVTIGGAGVAVSGAKGVGKTTLLLRLLSAPEVAYVSNDRVLVRPGPKPRALGVPTVVALRAGTRALLGDLTTRLALAGDFREPRLERRARGPCEVVRFEDTWHVSPDQLCRVLDRTSQASAPLAAVLFLTRDGSRVTRLHRLDRDEAVAALHEAVLCRHSGTYASEVFVARAGPVPDDAEMASRCRALASQVACFSGSVPDAAPPEDAAGLVAACIERGP